MGALPEESEFPGGAELLFTPLEALRVPGRRGACTRAGWATARRSRACAGGSSTPTSPSPSSCSSTHGPLSFAAEENRQLARELDAYLQSHERPPLLNVAISLAVGAPSAQRARAPRRGADAPLRHRRAAPAARAAARAVPRPPAARGRRHGARLRRRADDRAVRRADAGRHASRPARSAACTSAARWPAASRPVRFDITEASRTGRPPSILLAGTLGSGKTIAAELLAFQAERRGSLVVDVDPKPDHNLEGLPELDGRVHVIELSGDDRYRGLLDPLAVAPGGAARGPRQLVSDRAAAAGAGGVGDAGPQGRARSARARARRAACASLDLPARRRRTRTPGPPARRCRCGPTPASRGSGSATASAPASRRSGR